MKDKLKAAEQIMGISNLYKTELAQLLPAMAKTKITDKEWLKIVLPAFADNEKVAQAYLKGNFQSGVKFESDLVSTQLVNTMGEILEYNAVNQTQLMNSTKGTVWGAVNAVTGYFQNVETVAKNDSDKLTSILDGRIADKTQKVWDMAMTFMS